MAATYRFWRRVFNRAHKRLNFYILFEIIIEHEVLNYLYQVPSADAICSRQSQKEIPLAVPFTSAIPPLHPPGPHLVRTPR